MVEPPFVTVLTGDGTSTLAQSAVTGQGGDVGVNFVGGNLALDFVGTLNERFSSRAEQLRAPADLGRWFVAAGVLDHAPEVADDDLAQAIALREILFAVIAREIDGAVPRLTEAELTVINSAASVSPPTPALSSHGGVRRDGEVTAGLSAVARDAIGLFDRRDGSVAEMVRRRQLHTPVPRQLARSPAALVRDGRVRRPGKGRRVPGA
jgi:hypothetical protein